MNLDALVKKDLSEISGSFDAGDWDKNGFVVGNSALSDVLVEEIILRVEKIKAGIFETGKSPLFYSKSPNSKLSDIEMFSHVHWSDRLISSIALNGDLGKIAAKLLDIIRLWGSSIIYKSESIKDSNAVNWHRDMSFWRCVNKPKLLTFWFALDTMTVRNGCLEYAVGSHLAVNPKNDSDLPKFKSSRVLIAPGQFSIHHCLTGHKSSANFTETPRRALTIHLMAGNLSYVPNTDSDSHMNVYLLGKTTAHPFNNSYFPVTYDGHF